VRLAEELVQFLANGRTVTDFPTYLVESLSWSRFLSIQIWLMVLFLVYVTVHELNTLFGDGELYRLFFRWRSSEAKLTRRRRVRLLIRLNRLTEANSIEAISERGSPAYAELVDTPPRVLATALGGVATAVLMVSAPAGAATIVNGDFEAVQIGSPFLSSNPANIPGWTHTGPLGDSRTTVRLGTST
jgi:hypothetical protein